MTTNNEPIQLDKDITCKEPQKKAGKKSSKFPWFYHAGAAGLVLIVALLFINPDNANFIESPPAEEQAERDSIVAGAARIQQYLSINDSLPDPGDVFLPSGYTYEKEDELLWSIETEAGLYYSSDIDLEAFGRGEL
ncbi:MAG: hypothetical protein U9P42_04615 [Candidatus Fermentibacteria bacterium]|nr:hypothetical protein [Candidatus Fermentibacteria bacterium]